MTYLHGISTTEVTTGTRALQAISTAVIGLVATGPLADATMFPLNRPVAITDLAAAIGKAGATGTLKAVLTAIAAQTRAPVVVVRVAPGADAAATNTAVIGGEVNGQLTGLQALRDAKAQTGFAPRIIGAPGLDTQPVATALATLAQKLRARAYAAALGANVAAAIAYRANFAARELMLIWPNVLDLDGAEQPAAAYALGLRAAIDQETGFHKTLSNVPINDVTGLSKSVQFDYLDPSTEASLLNAAGITTLIRENGFRFWGSRNCSSEPLYAFESATATAQVLLDTIGAGMLWAIDKPLRPSLARDIVGTINGLLSDLVRDGKLAGGRAWFDPTANPVDQLAAGKLRIRYRYTPVPPLEGLLLTQEITDEYLADFAAGVAG